MLQQLLYRTGQYTYNPCVVLEREGNTVYLHDLVSHDRDWVHESQLHTTKPYNSYISEISAPIDIQCLAHTISDYVEPTRVVVRSLHSKI